MGCNFNIPERSNSDSDSFQSPLGIRTIRGFAEISSRRHEDNLLYHNIAHVAKCYLSAIHGEQPVIRVHFPFSLK